VTTMVTITNKTAIDALDLVHKLKAKGYVQGVDFDFAFYQSKWDDMIGEIPKQTQFTFYKEELATWFSLLYQ
jgi:hypothetical protein